MADSENRIEKPAKEPFANKSVSRRDFLKMAAVAGAAVTAAGGLGGLLSACGGTATTTSAAGATTTAAGTATTAAGPTTSGGGATTSVSTASGNPLNDIFGPGGPEGGQGINLKVGMLLAVTGEGSFFGDVMSKGAELAAKQIEAAGGPKFTIAIGDHQSGQIDPMISEYHRLVTTEKIQVLETSYGAPSEAIAPSIAQDHLLSFNGGGASPGQLSKPNLWMTRMLWGDDPVAGLLAYMAKNWPDGKRLAIAGMKENGVAGYTQYAPKYWPMVQPGGVIATNQTFMIGETNWGPLTSKLLASKPDIIFSNSSAKDQGGQIKTIREQGFQGPICVCEFVPDAAAVAGKWYNGIIIGQDSYDLDNPNPWNKVLVADYQKEYGKDPELFGANYYEMTFIYWDLIRRVIAAGGDPTNGDELNAALEKDPKVRTLAGGTDTEVSYMTFDPNEHTAFKPMGLYQMQNDKLVKLGELEKVKWPDGDPATGLTKELAAPGPVLPG